MNLGMGLANKGKKVLLVDCDPQGDLTTCLGWQRVDEIPVTLATKMHEIIRDDSTDVKSGILHHEEGVDLIPSNTDLEALEMYLVTAMSRENILKNYLNKVKPNYDYILIDTAPIGLVTDTLQIGRVADVSVYMCRADFTPKSTFDMINEIPNEQKLPKMALVLNGIDMSKKKYGYYYGYGKYGKYRRYGYGKYGRCSSSSYGQYGNYSNSHYGNKNDNSIKR